VNVLSIAWAAVVIIGLAIFGWMCVASPRAIIEWHDRHYPPRHTRLISRSLFPAYLRFMGIIVWLFDLLILFGLCEKLP
jgi:hypothetical protein